MSGADAVDSWYSEVKDYKFSKPGFQSNTGHFTQVVWKESREFGIGKTKSPDGKLFVVGRYRPAGNVLRHFQDNVLPKVLCLCDSSALVQPLKGWTIRKVRGEGEGEGEGEGGGGVGGAG